MLCAEYNGLVERHHVATSRYHQAVTKLMALVGQGDFGSFEEARCDCKVRLQDCKRAAAKVYAHQDAHGCPDVLMASFRPVS